MSKTIYIDTETTGLKVSQNNIIQIAGIVEINKEIKEEFNFFLKPTNIDTIKQEALDIQNKTKEEILQYPDQIEAFNSFIKILENYKNKFYMAGHNISFDYKFIEDWFIYNNKNINDYFKSNLSIDSLKITRKYKKALNLENCKLYTISKKLLGKEYEFSLHNAINDVYTTKACIEILYELYPEEFPKDF